MLKNEQYERIGRYLDGEDLLLSEAERGVAEQVRDDEARVAGMLAVTAPAGAIELAGQQALLARIRSDEAALAALLDVPVPRGTYQQVHRRVVAELARPQRRLMRIGAAAASVAAAAAIVLAVTLSTAWLSRPERHEIAARTKVHTVPVDVISASVEGPRDVAVDLLAKEIDQFEADTIAAAPSTALDMDIDQLERALEEFWLDPDEMLD